MGNCDDLQGTGVRKFVPSKIYKQFMEPAFQSPMKPRLKS